MQLKTLSTQWNTEFVEWKVEEIANLILSSKLMFNFQVNKSSSIHLLEKFRRLSIKPQLQS